MEQYNAIIATNDNVELIMVSFDRSMDEAEKWAKLESMPWPTLLGNDKDGSHFLKAPLPMVPTYRLYTLGGKIIAEGKKAVFAKLESLK